MSEWDWELTATSRRDFAGLDDHARDRIASKLDEIVTDEWREQKEQWVQDYREQGMDAPDEALVDAHPRAWYDVDLKTFENLVVDWSDKREAAELENILASGFRTAKDGIEQTTAVLEAADVDGEQVIEENDVVVSDHERGRRGKDQLGEGLRRSVPRRAEYSGVRGADPARLQG